MTMYDRIRDLRLIRGMSQQELAEKAGYKDRSAINLIENGKRNITESRIMAIAKALGVTPSFLMDGDKFDLKSPDISNDNVTFPVIGEVAAGFDKIAIEEWTGDTINIPVDFLKGRQQDEYFVLRVKGDSMYPDYRDGDKILVLKQTAIDYSGQIAVVIYGDDFGTIKKVEQRPNSIKLVPINPLYMSEEIKDTDIEKLHILGIPKVLIRDLEGD